MTVIPFDPKHRRNPRPETPETPETPESELDKARARLRMLERTLLLTLRENARNWARAERAEAELHQMQAETTGGPAAP